MAVLGKVMELGERETIGVPVPVPESVSFKGLAPSPPLYVTRNVVVLAPTAVGEKVAVMVQEAPIASVPPAAEQDPAPVLVVEKSPTLPPVRLGEMEPTVLLVPLVMVKVTGAEEAPTVMEPKSFGLGVMLTFPPV